MNTMKKDLATPRPWRNNNGYIYACYLKGKHAENFVGQAVSNNADAELIIRAVNNFDALLETCKEAIAYCPEPLRLKLITAIANAEK